MLRLVWILRFDFNRRRNDDISPRYVNFRDDAPCEGEEQCIGAQKRRDFQNIAAAEIVDVPDAAEQRAILVQGRKANQVGEIEFIARGRRKTVARQKKLKVGQAFGAASIIYACDPCDK